MKVNDRVRLRVPIEDMDLAAGTEGVVTRVYAADDLEYRVEFDGAVCPVVFTEQCLADLEVIGVGTSSRER